jgi:hypothetical protein
LPAAAGTVHRETRADAKGQQLEVCLGTRSGPTLELSQAEVFGQ